MRPFSLEEVLGQDHLFEDSNSLFSRIKNASNLNEIKIPSLIFWGPPGTGKTTLAQILCSKLEAHFEKVSAVDSGVKELRKIFQDAQSRKQRLGEHTILFVDEIHRFSKSQQDSFLHALEAGYVTLIGATTENPSFELNNALLSRSRVIVLKALTPEAIQKLLRRALSDHSRGLGALQLEIQNDAIEYLSNTCGGDARIALNALEYCTQAKAKGESISTVEISKAIEKAPANYDKNGEYHYDLISALHKSIRNSNPHAALFYLARMIEGGEDPIFIARRLVRAASEDIGMADPKALEQAIAAKTATEFIGMPESDVILAQCTLYLALAPKSNSTYTAIAHARKLAQEHSSEPVPLHLRNAPTKLMKDLGFGKDYQYDHNYQNNISPLESMPEKLIGQSIYKPGNLGFEKEIQKRMEYFETLRKNSRKKNLDH
ncbi:replication-associated recombination protein A [bacterium]|nr:replication-associated recombination protein A [bacterium]